MSSAERTHTVATQILELAIDRALADYDHLMSGAAKRTDPDSRDYMIAIGLDRDCPVKAIRKAHDELLKRVRENEELEAAA